MIVWIADGALFFAVGLAVFLLITSIRKRTPGTRFGRFAAVPLVIGLSMAVLLGIAFGERIVRLTRTALAGGLTPWWPIIGALLLLGAALLAPLLAELFAVVWPERARERVLRRGGDTRRGDKWANVASLVLVGALAAGSLVAATQGDSQASANTLPFAIVSDHELPGPPMDYEPVDEFTGYLSVAPSEVYLVRLPASGVGDATFEVVASGFDFVRGLAVKDDVLYVGDIGPICGEPYPTCFGFEPDAEREIIEGSNGKLIAFDIESDMTLGPGVEFLTGVPIVSSEHALNDVEIGPDGAIYVSVGNVDYMWEVPEQRATINHPNRDWLGTILRIDADTAEVEIFASGIRNIYGIDFDESGRVFGADNDGFTVLGWRPEMVLGIEEGDYFGYPFGPGAAQVEGATPHLWQLSKVASTAINWLGEGPWSPGLLIGAHDRLTYLEMGESDGQVFVNTVNPEVDVMNVTGYVTAIEQLRSDRILVGVTGIYGGTENRALILDLQET